jgi:hypothetical protein
MAGRKLSSAVDAWLAELAKKSGSRKSGAGATRKQAWWRENVTPNRVRKSRSERTGHSLGLPLLGHGTKIRLKLRPGLVAEQGPGLSEELSDHHAIANARHQGPFRAAAAGQLGSSQRKQAGKAPAQGGNEQEPGQREALMAAPHLANVGSGVAVPELKDRLWRYWPRF